MNIFQTEFEIAADIAKEWLHLPEPLGEDVTDKLRYMRACGAMEPDKILRQAKALHKFGRAILELAGR